MVEKWKFQFFDQKIDPGGQKSIFVQKNKVQFSTKICLKMVPRGLKLIFGREMKISIFWPKMDPGGQKSIFGQKIKSSIFRPKFAQK